MNCQGNTSACTGRDLMPTKLGLRRVLLIMCSGCRSTSLAMSVIVERRETRLTVLVERRKGNAPIWLSRLTARDETGRVGA